MRNNKRESDNAKKTSSRPRKKMKIKRSFIRLISTIAVLCSVFMIVGTIIVELLTKDVANLNKAMLEGRYLHSEIVKIDDVSEDMKNAIVAIEDSRFYSHKGVDLISLLRVFIKNSVYDTSHGGSTLEMQISKNLVTSTEQTIERKLKDMRVAHEMNKTMTKDEILQVYLNSIYLNRGATGIKAGARMFFAKDVSELNLAECALLAGITKNPSKYTAYNIIDITKKDSLDVLKNKLIFTDVDLSSENVNKEVAEHLFNLNLITEEQLETILDGRLLVQRAELNKESINRQKLVLKRMKELGFISKKELENALNTKIVIDTSLR